MAQYLSDGEVFGATNAAAYLSDDEVFGAPDTSPLDLPTAPAASGPKGSSSAPVLTVPKAERTRVPEGTWDDPREGSWDDRSEVRKGAESAVTGIKAMGPAAKVAGSALVINRIGERLSNWDKIDRGEYVPRAEGLAYQRADAEERQKLREDLLSKVSQQKEFVTDSVKMVKQYQQEQVRNKGKTADFTDIESVKDFENWLAFNGAAGAVYLAPVMLSAAIGGPVGAGAVSYVLAAGELNANRVDAAIDMNRPGRFKNPDRQDAVDQTQGVVGRVADTVPSTLAFAVPNAAMDVVAGPVRNVITKPLQGLTKRETLKAAPGMVARDIVEEGITGGLQEGVNIAAERYVGEQQGDILTKENAKRVVNAAAAEAAGGMVGGTVNAGTSLMTAPVVKTPEQTAASVMSAGTVEDAIAAAEQETSAPLPVVPARVQAAVPVVQPAVTQPAVNPQASAAVDRIGQILGQPQGNPDVSIPVGTPAQPAISSGAGSADGVGSIVDGGLQPDVGGRGVAPAGGSVASSAAPVAAAVGNTGAASLEPAATWVGRRGDGYATQEDAEAAIPSRQRARADLDWKIEPTAEGRFRLAGYANGTPGAAAPQTQQTPQGFRFTVNPSGTVTVQGDQQAIRSTLTNAGVTQFAPGTSGVMVGRSQAQQAVQALQSLEPQVRETTQRIQAMEQAPTPLPTYIPESAVIPAQAESAPVVDRALNTTRDVDPVRPATVDNVPQSADRQFQTTLNPSGTLTIKGDPDAIKAILKDAGIAGVRRGDGVLVGTKQAQAAQKLLAFQSSRDQSNAAPRIADATPAVRDAQPATADDAEAPIGREPEPAAVDESPVEAVAPDVDTPQFRSYDDMSPEEQAAYDKRQGIPPGRRAEVEVGLARSALQALKNRIQAASFGQKRLDAVSFTPGEFKAADVLRTAKADVRALEERISNAKQRADAEGGASPSPSTATVPAPSKASAEAKRVPKKPENDGDAFDAAMRHRAFHGTPHDFDKFTTEKIGTGEGAQAYGWGLYFAENKSVSENYQRTLSAKSYEADYNRYPGWEKETVDRQIGKWMDYKAVNPSELHLFRVAEPKDNSDRIVNDIIDGLINERAGSLYEVNIPDAVVANMLLWDKPLSEQTEEVRRALKLEAAPPLDVREAGNGWEVFNTATGDVVSRNWGSEAGARRMASGSSDARQNLSGAAFYKQLTEEQGSQEAASKHLDSLGIPGIRYLDGGSRNRTLREVKKEFLAQLPEDADFEEVLDLIGDGTFSPQNEAILTALADNDWLGFDYPAQAISAALSNNLANYDASDALVKAVEDAQKDATYNLVVFNDKNVTITHKDGSPVTKKERDDFLDEALGRGDDSAPRGKEPTTKQSARTAEVQKTVDELSAKWTDGPDIEVVASVSDLPGDHPADTRGMYQSGKVWIVADAYAHGSRKGIAKTLAHEVIAHHGLRKVLGRDEWNKLMSNIQLAIKAKNKPLSALRDEVREAYKDEDGNYDLSPAQESDEITALAVEQAIDADGNFRPGFGMFKAAFAKVAQFLRDIGLDVAFTNTELQGMLVLSMRGLQAGQRAEGGGKMALGGSTVARSQRSALQELSEADEVFALPKSDKDTVKGIASDVAPRVIVSAGKTVGLSTTYTLLDAQGGKAKLTVRKPNPYGPSVYSFESGEAGLKSDDERPGVNPYDVSPDVEDVYLDISDSKPGSGFGEIAYGIAANFAHNTNRIFIGDPNGLSDVAMRRRLEQMISSAIKFGTTAHIAPHPRQVAGDKRLGIPSLRWVYGDHEGNIERMIEASRQALAATFPSSKLIEYRDGEFYRSDTGQRFADRRQLAGMVGRAVTKRREVAGGEGSSGQAGWRTLARNALFSHLQSATDGEPGQRGRLLDRLRAELPRIGRGQSTGGTFEAKDRIFYARGGVSDQTETPAFKRWFAGSKVVDAAGKPLVVYHGTASDFDTFDNAKTGANDRGLWGRGHYFSATTAGPNSYALRQGDGARLIPAYLSVQNPLVLRTGDDLITRLPDGTNTRELVGQNLDGSKIKAIATDGGHDGVVQIKPDGAIGDVVAFDAKQIKSAIGNRGTFDPFDADIRHARSTTADTEQDAEEEAPTPASPTSPWRDSTGRLQFAPGVWLYEKLGQAAGPLLTKLQLKTASPELKRALREMKLQVSKAQETAGAVATEAMKLSEAERAMVSDLVEQELAAGTVPPAHALRLAAMINTTMGAQTDELVRLGMLTEESADLWRGKYLPRYYKNKLGKQVGDAWADAVQKMFGRTRAMAGIKGKHLRGRGLYENVQASEVAEWESLGWEVRDSDHPGANGSEISQKILADELSPNDTVQVWRDFTRDERDSMGEIRDAGFRFVMGYMQTQRDIALGQLFEHLAGNAEMSGKKETADFTIRVPDGTVTGTGAKRYGKLSGMWVSKDTFSHLSQIEESQSEAWQMYRKALGIWKEGKVVLNPVSHVNNIVSNLSMAHFAGVSYLRGDKYIAAARDFATKAAGVTEAKDAGLFLGTLSDAELMNVLPEDLKALVKQQDSAAKKIGSSAFNMLTFFLRRPMGWAYQAEDTFFRYLIYKDARERGLDPSDAVDYAQKYIFTYDDLPKGARMIRDFGVPFFAYTYKAIPALLHTAMTHPVRMAAPAAVLWGINAAAYAIAAGDDEDDWLDTLQKYITDADFRAKVKEKEQLEREHLPPWMKGSTSLGTPKAIRLGMDEVTKLPLFIDTSRIVPGGDLFDMHSNGGGIPWIQPLTPSNPILTTYMAMFGNKDSWFGKEIVDSNDTRSEAAAKRAEWLWKQATPAVAVGNYHFERGMNALAQASGGEVKWLPDAVSERYTGIGRDSLPVQPGQAAMQTFGIKVRPMDLDRSEAIGESLKKKMIRDIDAEMRSLLRLNKIGAVSDKVYDRKDAESRVKKGRLQDGLTVDGEKKG